MDTLIQVWGLWRSGTNYVEYVIRNNIKNNNYERREAFNKFSGKIDALKHCEPDISVAKYHICIYKPMREWYQSHERYDMKKTSDPLGSYVQWEKAAIQFCNNNPNAMLIDYNNFIGRELFWLREWNWDIEFNDIFRIPIKRMGRGSGTNFE